MKLFTVALVLPQVAATSSTIIPFPAVDGDGHHPGRQLAGTVPFKDFRNSGSLVEIRGQRYQIGAEIEKGRITMPLT